MEKQNVKSSWKILRKVLAENQTAKTKFEMFALKSFSESKQKLETGKWNPKWKLAKFACSS